MTDGPKPGTLVGGRYELIEIAGRGGMADVWRGKVRGDAGFQRPVAVKQMHAELALQPTYVAMFVEEARLGASLLAPNVAEVYDFVVDGNGHYMVLEWIEGIDLGSWVRWQIGRGEHPRWELVAAIAIGLLRGLAAAHERLDHRTGAPLPVVHRDVSPHNILLTTRGMVKVIDFGLALAPDRGEDTTDPGVVKGKMSYLSPEIVAGNRPVAASDQFATGSVLWEALVGRKLFDGNTDYETYTKVRDCVVPPLRTLRPDVPSAFTSIIHRALSANADERFPSAREMARQIGTALKKVQLRKDLHTLLARSVIDAREGAGFGARTGDLNAITPIADFLPEELPRFDRLPTPNEEDDKPRGLRHRLPAFLGGKRR